MGELKLVEAVVAAQVAFTLFGEALVCNCHLASEGGSPAVFPQSEANLPPFPLAHLLFHVSSEV